jgi:Ni,Fe-hydrogenase maturation factor
MKTILCFGNQYIENDNLAIKLSKRLKVPGFEFKISENPNDIMNYKAKDLILLDVAKGVKKVTVIDNIEALSEHSLFTLHDFDLNYFLKLMKAAGMLEKIKIIAVPMDYEEKKALEEVKRLLIEFSTKRD